MKVEDFGEDLHDAQTRQNLLIKLLCAIYNQRI